VEVTHGLGTVVLDHRPTRVVTLGAADTQIARALHATIVGAAADPTSADGSWPGVDPPLPDDVTLLDDDQPDLELLSSLHPDLILATTAASSYLQLYDRLSQVAPVVAAPGDVPLEGSGEELVTLVGRALGRDAEAADLVADSDQAVDDFVRSTPELAGSSLLLGKFADGVLYVVGNPRSVTGHLLSRLGLTLPADVLALASGGQSVTTSEGLVAVSSENLGLIDDADISIVATFGRGSAAEFTGQPVVETSRASSDGRLRMIEPDLATLLLEPNPAVTSELLRRLARVLGESR
jgi:iron complex transport system substrate-binding protein